MPSSTNNLQKSTREGVKTLQYSMSLINANIGRLARHAAKNPNTVHPDFVSMFTEAPVVMRVPAEDYVVDGIIRDGRMKNLFETGTGKGSKNRTMRFDAEEHPLQIPPSVPHDQRPLYGMLDITDYLDSESRKRGTSVAGMVEPVGGQWYGDMVFKMKPSVKKRSTIIHGDSMDDARERSLLDGDNAGLMANYMHKRSVHTGESPIDYMHMYGTTGFERHIDYSNYIEAQIHGGVYPAEDVDSIHLHVPKYMASEIKPAMEDDVFWQNNTSFMNAKRLADHFNLPLHVHAFNSNGKKVSQRIGGQKREEPKQAEAYKKPEQMDLFAKGEKGVTLVPAVVQEGMFKSEKKRDRLLEVAMRFAQHVEDTHGSDVVPDCNHASLACGHALEQMGHKVELVMGSATLPETNEEGLHWWLNVDGKRFDPKAEILKHKYGQKKGYTRYQEEWKPTRSEWDEVTTQDYAKDSEEMFKKSEESAKKRKVVASVAVFNPEGKMLWGMRNDTKKFTMPGGHLNAGELPVKGAVRELFEEAGLIPDELHDLGSEEVDSYDGKHKIKVHAFKAICGGKPHSKNDPDKECDEWHWVDVTNNKVPDEILNNLHSPKNVTLKLLGMQDWDELTKGSLQSKMRFDPTQADPSSHADIRDWQMGWAQDRSLIPEMQGEARFRALHKLHGATKARRGPTGEREFLLWRGHGPEMDVSGTHAVTDQRTGWTPDASIAAGFSHAGHMTGAWVPESAIVSIPKQLGQLRVSPYAQPDAKGKLIPKGANEMAPEYEVVVAPAKMEIAKVVPKQVARSTPIGQLTAEHLLGKSEIKNPPLSLELVCGQTGVDPEHPGYWEGPDAGEMYHPGHQRVKDAMKKRGIQTNLSSHYDDGYHFSDGYVKFHPHQIEDVVSALKEAGHPGDILDINEQIPEHQASAIKSVARREGWSIGDDMSKAEDALVKAIADIEPGKLIGKKGPSERRSSTHYTYDYSHLLPEHARNGEYSIELRYTPTNPDVPYGDGLYETHLNHNGKSVGVVLGEHSGDKSTIDTHSTISEPYRGNKFGKALYTAALAHAYHVLNAREVKGQPLSEEASHVHSSLSREHGMDYKPSYEGSVFNRKDKKTERIYSHPGYTIKSEEDLTKSRGIVTFPKLDAPSPHSSVPIVPAEQVQTRERMMGAPKFGARKYKEGEPTSTPTAFGALAAGPRKGSFITTGYVSTMAPKTGDVGMDMARAKTLHGTDIHESQHGVAAAIHRKHGVKARASAWHLIGQHISEDIKQSDVARQLFMEAYTETPHGLSPFEEFAAKLQNYLNDPSRRKITNDNVFELVPQHSRTGVDQRSFKKIDAILKKMRAKASTITMDDVNQHIAQSMNKSDGVVIVRDILKSSDETILDTLNQVEAIFDQLTKGQKTPSTSDATVMDIHRAPKHEMDLEFYRVTPKVTQDYSEAGREGVVKGAQYVSVPNPSGGSPTVAFDNPEDLHSYIKNKYEPFVTKHMLPANGSTVLLAPIPIRSMSHDNGHHYLNLDHLHGVSVAQDRRYRVPFYYTVAKDQAEKGYKHPMLPPLIAEYTSRPTGREDSHQLRITDGNGRSVSARTAGATHMLSYVQIKPEHVPDFLRMIHETTNDPELRVRKVVGAPELPSEFHIHEIPSLIEHVQKSETLDRFESLLKRLI